ncbi:drug/metabolite transporter (DMT)-like permease [Hoeflea marina]|uniref:Drug/metabolite transporter (DMT)-like permease n=1 Tax=Hoeflea marina TaxID=274592 RepID=A0A317PQV1_9HYPH|nr:DMT family transporter [Hoeflea marina]PWW03868.1 drug/metabolite transporter (DMT)-like permease [Hoeflea marina]
MDNMRGILLMVLAMAGFAAEDMFIKLAASGLPVGQILAVLGLVGALMFAAYARANGMSVVSGGFFHPAVVVRNLTEMLGGLCFVTALTLIPLATATTILQATPLLVTMGAALVLGEAVGWRRWTAILIGFGGVLLVIRPGLEGFEPEVLWAVLGVVGLAIRDLASRKVPRSISSLQLSAWGFFSVGVSGVVLLAVTGGAVLPTVREAGYLTGALSVGVLAYWALTEASRIGDISVVTPFRYSRLVFSMIVGMLVFAEFPDIYTLTGAGIIIATGLFTIIREQRRRRQDATAGRPATSVETAP